MSNVAIIDFLGHPDDNTDVMKVVASVALPKEAALDLSNKIQRIYSEEEATAENETKNEQQDPQ